MAAAYGTWRFGLQVVGLVWDVGYVSGLRDAAASWAPDVGPNGARNMLREQ